MVMMRLASGDLFALAVDQVHNSSDLVVKPLPREVMDTGLYGGSTLLDSGLPILLLDRSEEHTSELQSLMRISYAVFCLKKKNNIEQHHKARNTKTIQLETYHDTDNRQH